MTRTLDNDVMNDERESMRARLRVERSNRSQAAPGLGPVHGRVPDSVSDARRRLRGDRGDVGPLVVVTPVMVMVVMLVIQMGLYYHARSVMSAAAQDGARAYQNENGTDTDARFAANQILNGSGSLLENELIAVSASGSLVTVTITAQVTSLIPFFDGTVAVEASGAREGFTSESTR